MQSRNIILCVAGVLAAFVGFLIYRFYSDLSIQNQPGKAEAYRLVFVASHDLQARAPVSVKDVESVSRPVSSIDPDPILSLSLLKGKVALTTIPSGAVITRSRLGKTEEGKLTTRMRPGMRAITIPIDAVRGVSSLIEPGDRVDIMSVQQYNAHNNSSKVTKVSTILRRVLVLAMGKDVEKAAPNKDGSADNAMASTATLALNPKESEELALADSTSTLRLTLRPAKEHGKELPVKPYVVPMDTSNAPSNIEPASVAVAPAPMNAGPPQVNNDPPAPEAPNPLDNPTLANTNEATDVTLIDGDHVVGEHK